MAKRVGAPPHHWVGARRRRKKIWARCARREEGGCSGAWGGAPLRPVWGTLHVAGVWPGPAFALGAGHTIYENTPFSRLPTVVDERFAGAGRARGAAGFCVWDGWSRRNMHRTSTSPLGTVRTVPFVPLSSLVSPSSRPLEPSASQGGLWPTQPTHRRCTLARGASCTPGF